MKKPLFFLSVLIAAVFFIQGCLHTKPEVSKAGNYFRSPWDCVNDAENKSQAWVEEESKKLFEEGLKEERNRGMRALLRGTYWNMYKGWENLQEMDERWKAFEASN